MSKYQERGDYHYQEFADANTTYHKHVTDLLSVVKLHTPAGATMLDIGCGEGLILSRLDLIGYNVLGCDIDKHAVKIALDKHNPVIWGTYHYFNGLNFDVVLMLDMLEHAADVDGALRFATERAAQVIVAIPDREDAHAINNVAELLDQVRDFFSFRAWKLLHHERRHARHLMVFKR